MLKTGSLVKSMQGHDKGRTYMVAKLENDFVYLVDGKFKTLEKPKKKRIKHVKDTFKVCEFSESLKDFEIDTLIRKYNKTF